jgi:hypothetical protein
VVDALSRRDEDPPAVFALSLPGFELYDQLRGEAATLQDFIDKRATIVARTAGPGWSIINGVITFKGRIFLAQSSSAWAAVFQHAHDMGHEGIQKTLHHLRASFFTP